MICYLVISGKFKEITRKIEACFFEDRELNSRA